MQDFHTVRFTFCSCNRIITYTKTLAGGRDLQIQVLKSVVYHPGAFTKYLCAFSLLLSHMVLLVVVSHFTPIQSGSDTNYMFGLKLDMYSSCTKGSNFVTGEIRLWTCSPDNQVHSWIRDSSLISELTNRTVKLTPINWTLPLLGPLILIGTAMYTVTC
jgi:hypothetical protein